MYQHDSWAPGPSSRLTSSAPLQSTADASAAVGPFPHASSHAAPSSSSSSLGSAASILKDLSSVSSQRRRGASSVAAEYGFKTGVSAPGCAMAATNTNVSSSGGCSSFASGSSSGARMPLATVTNTRMQSSSQPHSYVCGGPSPQPMVPFHGHQQRQQQYHQYQQHHPAAQSSSSAHTSGVLVDRRVLFTCLQRFVLEGTMLGRYFSAWRRYRALIEYRREQLAVLHAIRREAHVAMLTRCFAKLHRRVARRRACLALPGIAASASLSLGYHALLQWRYYAHLRQAERRAAPALATIARTAKLQLAVRAFSAWRRYSDRRQRHQYAVMTLTADTSLHTLRRAFALWMRRRHGALRVAVLGKMGRKIQREGVRHCLRAWVLFAMRRQLARRFEQFHLFLVVRRHFRAWAGPTQRLLRARSLEEHSLAEVAGGAFVKWYAWLQRRIVAARVEQQVLVMLLRRYFISWRRSHTRSRLSYGSYMERRRRGEGSTATSVATSRSVSVI